MEKVKVNKEVYSALKLWEKMSEKPLEFGLHQLLIYRGFQSSDLKPINELNIETFSKSMINGYELEKTPAEKLTDLYAEHRGKGTDFTAGIYATLQTLNIKIKGINA